MSIEPRNEPQMLRWFRKTYPSYDLQPQSQPNSRASSRSSGQSRQSRLPPPSYDQLARDIEAA